MINSVYDTLHLETLRVYCLLGVRLWDLVQNRVVRNGLVVRAWPMNAPQRVTYGQPTTADVYAFHNLPGMHHLERPAGETRPWEAPSRIFTVEVVDKERRFLPLVFTVDVPFKGVFPTDALSSPPYRSPTGAYLFSSPARATLSDWAVVRATLVEAQTEQPVAHAAMEVTVAGRRHYGLADHRGNAAVYFPYPNFLDPGGLASPGEEVRQVWAASLRVRTQPERLTRPPGTSTPTIRSIFEQQEGEIWQIETASGGPVYDFELVYGEEAVIRTAGRSALCLSPVPVTP
jgi:hypothetical protein